jgi:phospholipid/cholesterol/gamma-HCH transport system substrate-binding protein
MNRDPKAELKVGLFVLTGLALLVAIIVVLGSEQNLFERNMSLHAKFSDISGLRNGAAVRLAGLDVGTVTGIEFPANIEQREVWIHMRVAERFRERIRGDSVATISSMGLLGDKFIALSIGSHGRNPLEDGSWLDAVDPVDLFAGLGDIKDQVSSILRKVDDILGSEGGESAGQSILGILASLRNIIEEVERGEGIIHELVYDKRVAKDVTKLIGSIRNTADTINALVVDVRTGDGAIHDLIYEDKLTEQLSSLLADLQKASKTIDEVVAEVKTGDGLIHDLVYGSDRGNLIRNLNEASADIKDIIASVKSGEGTVGALLVDPSLYGDLKTLLGGAQRNKILKTYVRDTMRRNERREGLTDGGELPPPGEKN